MARSKSNRNTERPNVVHKGQRATLNGKPVIADGKGNWVAATKGTYGNAQYSGAKSGTYKKGENRKSTPTKPTKPTKTEAQKRAEAREKTSYTVSGVEYWRHSGKAKDRPGGFASPNGYSIDPKTGKRTNGHTAPPKPKPKPTPKVTPPKAVTPKKTSPKAATSVNAQNLRSGPTPPKTTKTTKPANKVYGSKGKKGLKQSSRMADALSSLKVRDYKKKK